jgi:protein-disulfide isomerase
MSRGATRIGGLIGLAAAIVVVAIAVSSGGDSRAKGTGVRGAGAVTRLLHGIPQRGLELGSPKAPVTIVEFADPQCPFCRQYSVQTWPSIVRRYVRTGKARMELRLVGFLGEDSVKGAKALEAAGLQHKLWDATAIFYDNQRQENSGYVTDAFLRRVLGAVDGLDVERAMARREHPDVTAQLGASRTAQSRYAVSATPTLLVGPTGGDVRKVAEEVLSPEQFGAVIDAELAKAARRR